MKIHNYSENGQVVRCGHCNPEYFLAVEPCECVCHQVKELRKSILDRLEIYHAKQGIAFLSPKDAMDYFKGLTELIEDIIAKRDKELVGAVEKMIAVVDDSSLQWEMGHDFACDSIINLIQSHE